MQENKTKEDISEAKIKSNLEVPVLLSSILIISICAILYELLISTISTYFLGSSILHFSITIGIFLSSMGLGAFLSKYLQTNLLDKFITIEIILGSIGGFSSFLLYLSFSLTQNYYLVLFGLIVILGTLIGLEIPLLTRVLKSYSNLKETIANVLAFDYLGALIASIVFPLVLLPYMGIMRTSFLVGFINLGIAFFNLYVFRAYINSFKNKIIVSSIISFAMIAGFSFSFSLVHFFEEHQYQDQVIFSRQSAYQRIIVTRWNQDFRLYLDGNLQFSTVDEYRYHEPLVHVPMLASPNRENILVLGGGDGLAIRELLKYREVQHIDLVDIDSVITQLAKNNPIFRTINKDAMYDQKVTVFNEDAFNFVKKSRSIYNVIIIDFPDPNDYNTGKLYSKEFYEMTKKILAKDGFLVTQATSPYFAPEPYWCINNTLKSVYQNVTAYKAYVPSFGLWGFHIAGNIKYDRSASVVPPFLSEKNLNRNLPNLKLKYLNKENLPSLFQFDEDLNRIETNITTIDNPEVVKLYEKSWKYWN